MPFQHECPKACFSLICRFHVWCLQSREQISFSCMAPNHRVQTVFRLCCSLFVGPQNDNTMSMVVLAFLAATWCRFNLFVLRDGLRMNTQIKCFMFHFDSQIWARTMKTTLLNTQTWSGLVFVMLALVQIDCAFPCHHNCQMDSVVVAP